MRGELSTHGYHDREYYQRHTSILPAPTELGRPTRIVQPSPFGYRREPLSFDKPYPSGLHSERLPPWFTPRSSRYPYGLNIPSTSVSAAEIAHRSLARDLHTPHNYQSKAFTREAERYDDRFTTYYPSCGPGYSLIQKKKKKKKKNRKADDVHVQRRGDELLFIRNKGRTKEKGGWRKTEKEVEWHRERSWM